MMYVHMFFFFFRRIWEDMGTETHTSARRYETAGVAWC